MAISVGSEASRKAAAICSGFRAFGDMGAGLTKDALGGMGKTELITIFKMKIRYWLLDLAHDDSKGNWHKYHDFIESIAYSKWLS